MPLPEPDDVRRVVAKLDKDFVGVYAKLLPDERVAASRWQQPGRGYEAVQRFYRLGSGTPNVIAWARGLDELIDRGELARELVVWRGLRSSQSSFGVASQDIGRLVGSTGRFAGLVATTLSRRVAVADFTKPELAGGPLLLHMRLPIGLPVAWLAAIGRPELKHQLELLLPDDLGYRIVSATVEEGMTIMDVEVAL